ncbi:hypothetical protein, conserved [Eimeria acervulina]|uniref:Uncharacterized protein n=1 Tax=Eimeria acervulina TaxID=5801 RepID=U6G9R5_EIMAC|nr:hypothetical protein, conserved [Eimeria acervulina]CDI76282.1 hypothetical protein, conserved [Eimeria acervulina]
MGLLDISAYSFAEATAVGGGVGEYSFLEEQMSTPMKGVIGPGSGMDLLSSAGHTPRRLSVSAAMINFATQVATSQEIRQLMGQWTGMMGEIFKGPDTSESSIPFYWKLPECVMTVDFASVADVAAADAAKISLFYTPSHNAIVLTFVEEAAEWIQLFKGSHQRMQFLYTPAECMVDENTTYSPFCTKPTGRCFMTRLDIHLTRITRQLMSTLKPLSAGDFIKHLMDEENFLYDDAADVLEAPTTPGRLLFEPLNCIMHARVQAISPQHIFLYFNPYDHSLRVDAQNTDQSWYRRKVIIPLGCGGKKEEDFTAAVYLQSDGYYKVVIQAVIARGTDLERKDEDTLQIPLLKEVRPTDELRYGEHDPKDMYPNDNYIPLETMLVGHPF